MTTPRILVAGIGNIFLGDDAFGVEVARRLAGRAQPAGVRVVDFGIRGFDLAYALMEDNDAAILVDAVPRGQAPGSVSVIEPDWGALDQPESEELLVETHGMNPLKVLRMVKAMGGSCRRVLVVGCEPGTLEMDEEGQFGLTEPVQQAVDEAVRVVEALVAQIAAERRSVRPGDAETA